VALGTARVTRPLLRLRAVPRNVSALVAVVALSTLHAVARKMANTTTCVAGLATAAERSTTEVGSSAGIGSTSLRARPGDVPDLATLVALLATTRTAEGTRGAARPRTAGSSLRRLGAVAGEMTLLSALVAGLRLSLHRAVTGDMSLLPTVVTGRSTRLGALRSEMAETTAIEASTTGHFFFLSSGWRGVGGGSDGDVVGARDEPERPD